MRRSPLTPYPSTRAVAAEQRGAKTKEKREIGLLHAGMVWLACRLALEGDGISGPMGGKSIASYLNAQRIFPRARRKADPMSSRNGSPEKSSQRAYVFRTACKPCWHLRSAPRAPVTQGYKTDDQVRSPTFGVALLGRAANF